MSKAPTSRSKKGPKGMAIFIAIIPLAIVFMPVTTILVAGLIPSLIAYIVDSEKQKLTALTVGALNFAGVMPVIHSLWQGGVEMSTATHLLSNPLNWGLMFAGAGVGWVLALVVPPLIASGIIARDDARLRDIRTRQEQLVDEWGPAVSDINSLRR